MRAFLLMLLPACLAVAGCAAPGPYPSLAVRDVEARYAAAAEAEAEAAPLPVIPADAALAERIQTLIAQAAAGQAAFAAEFPAARAAAARAGSAGGEAWIAAQQAISRTEAARTPTARALGDLDALVLREAVAAELSAADYALLTEAIERVAALRNAQDAALQVLKAALRPI